MPKVKRQTKKNVGNRRTRVAAARQAPMPDYDQSDHVDSIVALANPFSSLARGSRLPDMGASRTVTETVKALVVVNTVNTGAGCTIFQANPKFCNLNALAYAAPDFNMVTSWSPVGTNSTQLATRGRVVSFGIRVVNTLSATNSTGMLALFKLGRAVPSIALSSTPSLYPYFEVHPLTHGGEWQMVAHQKGNDSLDWTNYVTDTATVTAPNPFEMLGVMVLGSVTSLPVLQVEVYMNCEYQVDDDNPLAQYAQTQPTYNPQLLAAVNHVQTEHSGIHSGTKESTSSTIKRHAMQAAKKHVLPFLKREAIKQLERAF